MAGTLAPQAVFTGFDNNGLIMPGGKLYTFTAGTSSAATTWSDSALAVPNANPIILDSAGRCVIYLALGVQYKFILKTSADVTIWTQDNIASIPLRNSDVDVTGVAGETLTVGQPVYLSKGDGGFTAGSWYRTIGSNSFAIITAYKGIAADLVGFVIVGGTAGTSITVRVLGRVTGLTGLSAGTIQYTDVGSAGLITNNFNGGSQRALGIADTTSTLVITANDQRYGSPYFQVAPRFDLGQSAAPLTVNEAVMDGTLTTLVDTADHANGTTVETTASSFTLYSNTFTSITKGSLKVSFTWSVAANGNTKTVKFYFGATSVTVYTGAQNGGTGHAEIWVTRTGNTTQKITGFMSAVNGAGTGTTSSFSTTAAETMASDILVKTTYQSGTASNDLTQNMFIPQVSAL